MFRRTKVCAGVIAALGGTLLAASMPAAAQGTERIEITGSNIRRVQSETASPVQTVTAEDIQKSGKTSVAELLQTLSVDNQGSVPMTFGSGFAAGASGISLRGLGSASTLVLVNGRRVAPYGLADDGQKVFADLNVIPLEAVDRVEILKDGGSAIYGSDAIAGVVNIILRKDFSGVVVKAGFGMSGERDGKTANAAITAGFGSLEKDKFNILLNFEATKKDEIWNRDRAGRGAVGRGDLRDLGFSAQEGLGGTGAIVDNNLAGSAINGNVRQPGTNDYYNRGNLAGAGFTRTFPNAACSNFTSHPQGDPLGGCLIDATQIYDQIQPSQDTLNFFGRGTFELSPAAQLYGEFNLYKSKSKSSTTPSGVSASVGYPGGPVPNNDVRLGAAHPDNPYFGSSARIRYLAADVGPRVSNVDSTFSRLVFGSRGTLAGWDYDTAFLTSQNKVTNTRTGYLQRDATFALLNPTGTGATQLSTTLTNDASARLTNAAYAALPAGTFWRIAENANLNSAAVYAALSPEISNDAKSKTSQIDLRVSRDVAQLPGGPLGLALGAEYRRESVRLDPTSGTERGNIIGLGYSAYDGKRTLTAAYAEVLAPVIKQLELSAAVRGDHYSDVGNSFTPKFGAKFTPINELALRTSFARGFRAPSPAENGKGGLAAFTTAADPLRCDLGIASACNPGNVAIITSPNPDLDPEKSSTWTAGLVFDPFPGTSIAFDYFRVTRKNEINQETSDAAIAAGHVVRDPNSATATPGDPGPIIAVLTNYINSTKSRVTGFDVDLKQTINLGGAGRVSLGVSWTHLLGFKRTDPSGVTVDFAGTHGNCDVTNCIGTPDDRLNFSAGWEIGDWRVAGIVNYRGSMENKLAKSDTECAFHYADGRDAPDGCKIKSFYTLDLTARWKPIKNLEVFGSIQNLFDRKPPLDPLTYGADGYNPLDYSGAVGRFFSIGARYSF